MYNKQLQIDDIVINDLNNRKCRVFSIKPRSDENDRVKLLGSIVELQDLETAHIYVVYDWEVSLVEE